jgi:lipopolysaccharide/colanic/teichoic acid biosynthesis glycosyltransferase
MTAHRYGPVKRGLDLAAAGSLLLLMLPVLLVMAGLVLATLGRPVLFRQARAGRHGRVFRLVKFRTMRPEGARSGAAADADRLTRVGRWLRATSLDELPTLWNVLCGEMSLVGPRPLLVEYLDRYTPEQARRHQVRPGITGLAQVCGRNLLAWDRKLELDLQYVRCRGLWLDLWILAQTGRVVLRREGVSAPGCATAREFVGAAGPVPSAPARTGRP